MKVINILNILDTFSKRTIRILKILSEENDWITIKEISKQLTVSEKTIQENLKYIREELNDKLYLETSNTKGIRTIDFPINSFLEVQSLLLTNSLSIKFIIELLKRPFYDINYYAEKLHVSRSTLYRNISIINEFFEEYDIKIHRERSLYSIIGDDEYTCRRFFTTFIFEIYEYKTHPFIPEDSLEFYKERIHNTYALNDEVISDLQLAYYSIFYHFSIIREQTFFQLIQIPTFKGKNLPIDMSDLSVLESTKNLSVEIIIKLEQSICIHRHSMCLDIDKFYIRASSNFINDIYQSFSIENDDRKKLLIDFLSDLCLNVKYYKIPYHFFSDRFSSFASQIKINNPIAYHSLKNLIYSFSKKVKLDFSTYENHLIYLFVVTLPTILQAKIDKPLLFVSNYSEEHSYFISNIIQSQLGISSSSFNSSKHIHYDDLPSINTTNYNMIISNIDLGIPYPQIVLVNDFPTKNDINKVKKHLDNLEE